MNDLPAELQALLQDDWKSAVARISKNDPTLTSLDLKFKNIDKDAASAIALALKQNTNLTNLNLISNQIGDQGNFFIFSLYFIFPPSDTINFSNIRRFSIGHCIDNE